MTCVFLKNYINDYWFDNTEKALINPQKKLTEEVKIFFKENIINILFKIDKKLLPLVKNMIEIIITNADGYFKIWPDLMKKLSLMLQDQNYQVSIEIYHLISKIIRRYHIQSKSKELFIEIINTMNEICEIFTKDAKKISEYLVNNNNINENDIPCLLMLKHIMSIFYSLNYQDFPEFFEDNLKDWLNILANTLSFNIINISNNNVYEKCINLKAKTMKNINLYYSNYYDDIYNYVSPFYNIIWNITTMIKKIDSYSKLTRELLDFFKICFSREILKNLDDNQINNLIQNLISPNLQMTEKEQEEFEDNPVSYLKVELEENDMESNKYYAINLLRQIINQNPKIIDNFIIPTINSNLQNYSQNKQNFWNLKIIAINLIFAVQIKTFAQRIGVTELNQNSTLNLNNMISEVFMKEFQDFNSPIVSQVYTLKFLTTFRLQIQKEFLPQVLNILINILNNSNNITKNACLLTVEKILFMRDKNTREALTKDAVNNQEIFGNIISSLMKFIVVENPNIFAMRCFYRTLFLTDENYYKNIINDLTETMNNILNIIIKKSEQDEFNYYYFETCSLIIKKLVNIDINSIKMFENKLHNNLNIILINNVTDLLGYTFQFFAHYLNISHDFSDYFGNLLNNILTEQNSWNIQYKYLFNPYLSFIKVSFIHNSNFYNTNKNYVDKLFIICSILINYSCYSQLFELLDYLINFIKPENYYESLCNLLITTNNVYNKNKNENPKSAQELGKEMILFISKLSIKIGMEKTMEIINKLNGINYLKENIDMFSYTDDNKNKKLILFLYCNILNSYYNNLDQNFVLELVNHLIKVIQNFYKINFNNYLFSGNNNDISYAAHNYNKLINANIFYDLNDYKKVFDLDENNILFNVLKNIKEKNNVNYITQIINTLKKPREIESIKQLCNKNNFPIN